MIKEFGHVCVLVKDLERALSFYRDRLGLEVVRQCTVEGKYPETAFRMKGVSITYVKLRCPGRPGKSPALLELQHWKRPKRLPAAGLHHISFIVDGLEREYRRLRRRGVRFLSGPVRSPSGDTMLCFARDPDGNLIEFVERTKPAQ